MSAKHSGVESERRQLTLQEGGSKQTLTPISGFRATGVQWMFRSDGNEAACLKFINDLVDSGPYEPPRRHREPVDLGWRTFGRVLLDDDFSLLKV